MKKRGLSPVIATTLLVLVAIVLAALIFFWARSLVGEKLQKDTGSGEEQNIDLVCSELSFNVDVKIPAEDRAISDIILVNQGTVPIYGVQIVEVSTSRKKILGRASSPPPTLATLAGQSQKLVLDADLIPVILRTDSSLIAVPVLSGTDAGGQTRQHICNRDESGISLNPRIAS